MLQGKTLVAPVVTLVIGFSAGFILRPILSPIGLTVAVPAAPAHVRAKQYFAANLSEARQIVVGCRDGSVRGDECANAEQAITEADGQDRFKKFMGN